MDLDLQDKVAIVTGASRGIGEGIAEVLAAEGCDVFLIARSAADLERVAGAIRTRHGRRALTLVADLSNPAAPAAAVAARPVTRPCSSPSS